MPTENEAPATYLSKDRIAALGDGVFAIAITVLALELTQLVTEDRTLSALWTELRPRLLAYVLSSMILALFWVAHQIALSSAERTDRRHALLNVAFLVVVAAIPVPAALIGTHPDVPGAFAVYGAVLTLSAVLLSLASWYAPRPAGQSPRDDAASRALRRRLRWAIAGYALSVSLAFLAPPLGLAAFFLSHATLAVLPVRRGRLTS